MTDCHVVILGAGPYGLAAANHLRQVKGLDVRIFGEPMSFWERHMPLGMFLRSNWTASQISDPNHSLTLDEYQRISGNHLYQPLPIERFIQYAKWYQQRALPDLDRRKIDSIESHRGGFKVTLSDSEVLICRRVVVAAGIGCFAWRPPEFDTLPSSVASHTSEHRDLRKFTGKQMLVVGAGQSALESAALLHEAGADVQVVARTRKIHWLQGSLSRTLHHGLGKLTRQVLYAPTDVGPAGISQLMARPDLLRRLPRRLQEKLRKRSVRPAGARWLLDRLRRVPIHLGQSIMGIASAGGRVRIRLSDGSERVVDHVLLGTGYRVDVSKYDFLAPGLLQSMRISNGYPCLKDGLETSVPGLHILGAPAARTFGPLMQFVSGTGYASQALSRCIAANNRGA